MAPSGLSRAIVGLLEDLPEELFEIFQFLEELAWSFVFPAVGGIIGLALVLHLLGFLQKHLFPPDAKQLYLNALNVLKKSEAESAGKTAEALLRKSIKKDETFLPSYLTLASLLLYVQERTKEADQVIQQALGRWPKHEDLKQLELDVKATQHNMGHMVKTGGFASKHLGDRYAFSDPMGPTSRKIRRRR